MLKRMLFLTLLLVVAGLIAPVAEATSWIFIPNWRLVDMADVIVVGKVTKIEGGGGKYEQAVIEVSEVLKGPAGLKEVRLRQLPQPPAGAPVIEGLPLRYPAGTHGIFLVKKDAKEALYGPPTHPSEFQALQQKDEIVKTVKVRANVPGGKAVGGLVARAELESSKQANAQQIWFSLKNDSDKPILVCNYVAHRPLQVDWIGPDGKKRDSKHYAWLDDPRIGPQAPLSAGHFITLPPGGVCFLGPRGDSYQGFFLTNPERGAHKLTIRFGSKEDGKKLSLKDVWTGDVVSSEVVVIVK